MIPLVVIRPQPGCAATASAARAMRMEAHEFPLFKIVPRIWSSPDPAAFDAILAGSANVFRHGGDELDGLRNLPVHAVGETTASAAREAGFTVAGVGNGGLQQLLNGFAGTPCRLLRLAGEERVSLLSPDDVSMVERVVYASRPLPLPNELAGFLRAGAIVVLHSGEAARHLATQCGAHAIARTPILLAALSHRIAVAAGDGWGEVAIAAEPNDNALLALARQMCQD